MRKKDKKSGKFVDMLDETKLDIIRKWRQSGITDENRLIAKTMLHFKNGKSMSPNTARKYVKKSE